MFKDYFKFSKVERRGTVILIICILFFILIPKFYPVLFPHSNHIDYSKMASVIAKWDSLKPDTDTIEVELFVFNPNTATQKDLLKLGLPYKVVKNIIGYRTKRSPFSKKEQLRQVWDMTDSLYQRIEPFVNLSQEREDKNLSFATSPKMFDFDPNTVTQTELLQLGLSKKVAASWINWRNKGAVFYKKEKVKKVYGLKEADYNRLEPYIVIQRNFPNADEIPKSYEQRAIKIDVNTATAEEFIALKGIGEKTAARIVKFRNALGGFTSIKQVSETWGLPKETFYNLQPQFSITKNDIQTLNINTATPKELSKHPYLNWKQANAIVNYRTQNGNFEQVKDLKNIVVIDGILYDKIESYLSVE